jgi:hypothetical protein
MQSFLAALLACCAFVPLAGRAQAADPLKSPECGAAIEQLQAARTGTAAQAEAARKHAATTCLGAPDPPRRPGRVLQAPIVVPRTAFEPKPLPRLTPPRPALEIDRPATISSCDATGCWLNQGNRLQHVTPNMMGPSGLCGLAPGAAGCP